MKLKVMEFIEKLNKIGYDEETEIEFSVLDFNGEVYDLEIDNFIYGDDLSIPNVNAIDIEIKMSDEYIKEICRDKVEELRCEIMDTIKNFK